MKLVLLLTIVFITLIKPAILIDVEVLANQLKDYLVKHNSNSLLVFTCFSEDGVGMQSKLNHLNVSVWVKSFDQKLTTYINTIPISHSVSNIIFTQMDCQQSITFFKQCSKANMMRKGYNWILQSDSEEVPLEALNQTDIDIDSTVIFLSGITVYQIKRESRGVTKIPILNWQTRSEKLNLNSRTLTAAIIADVNQSNRRKVKSLLRTRSLDIGDIDATTAYSYTIHQYLQDMYNFKIKIELTKSVGYYDEVEPYKKSQIGLLEDKKVDFGFSAIELHPSTVAFLDWLPPVKTVEQAFLLVHPHIFTQSKALFKTLEPIIWWSILSIINIYATGLTIISLFKLHDSGGSDDLKWSGEFLQILGSIAQQGLTNPSMRFSKRVAHFFLLILSMLGYAFYNSALVIFLLSPVTQTIHTVNDLTDSGIELVAEDLPINRFHLNNPIYPEAQAAYEDIQKPMFIPGESKFYELDKGVEHMKNSASSLYSIKSNIYEKLDDILNDEEKCRLFKVRVHSTFQIAVPLVKNSPFKEIFTQGVLKIKEAGLIYREDKYWLSSKPTCMGSIGTVHIGLSTIVAACKIYLFGLLTSINILVLEIFWAKLNMSKKLKCLVPAMKQAELE